MIFTLFFPAGGVMLGVGLKAGISSVWGIGIALIVLAFYVCPVVWSAVYAPKRSLYRLVQAVEEEHLYTVKELSEHLNLSEKDVRSKINICIEKRYLRGVKRNGDELILNTSEALEEREYTLRCPGCGATSSFKGLEKPRCPYCGTYLEK